MISEKTIKRAKEVKSMDIRKVVDDPEWQTVRKSLIGNWVNNHKQNIKTLRAYWNKDKENPLVVRRILNVLVGSVHRTLKTKNQPETDALRKDIRIAWRNMLGEDYDKNDPRYKTGTL